MIMIRIHSNKTAAMEADQLQEKIVGAMRSAMNGPGGFTATAKSALTVGGHVASKNLRQSTGGEVESDGNRVLGIVRTEVYGPYVEFGTRPHWPPLTALLNWVAQKHIAEDTSDKGKAIRGKWRTATQMSFSDAQDMLDRHRAGLKVTNGQLRSARLRVSLGVNREYAARRNATERAQLAAARAIQVHIARHGTEPHPFLVPGIDAAWAKLLDRLRRILGGN